MKLIYQILPILALATMISCSKKEVQIDRPQDPWVFRSVLDSMPRMLTVALNNDIWAAYSAENGNLYKAWQGGVNFEGAVYDNAHGPQPTTVGDSWLEGQIDQPWTLTKGGQSQKPTIAYKGHRFENDKVWINYELHFKDGIIIKVSEQPEGIKTATGQVGFERLFKTKGIPKGAKLTWETVVSSIASPIAIKTEGSFDMKTSKSIKVKGLYGIEIKGRLTLKSNGLTRFTTLFVKKPLIKHKKAGLAEEDEGMPLGLRLIAKSDCRTCHNIDMPTVGPAYMDVAKRYENNAENFITLR